MDTPQFIATYTGRNYSKLMDIVQQLLRRCTDQYIRLYVVPRDPQSDDINPEDEYEVDSDGKHFTQS